MAKSKIPKIEDLRAHFFMSIRGNHVDIIYHDDTDNGAAIGAALASLMEEDEKLFDIFSAAFLTVMTTKEEKSISKTPKKAVKTPVKAAKRK